MSLSTKSSCFQHYGAVRCRVRLATLLNKLLGEPALIHPFLAEIGKDRRKSSDGDIDTGAAALHLAIRCGSCECLDVLFQIAANKEASTNCFFATIPQSYIPERRPSPWFRDDSITFGRVIRPYRHCQSLTRAGEHQRRFTRQAPAELQRRGQGQGRDPCH